MEKEIRVSQRVEAKGRYLFMFQSGNLAQNLLFVFISTMLTYFYTQIVGLSPLVAGTIYMVATIIDAVIDPLIGMIMQKTNSKYGKFVPYLAIFAPVSIAAFVLMFMAPELSDAGKIFYSYTTYIVFCLSRSFVQISFQSLAVLTSSNVHRRQKYLMVRNVFAKVAQLLVTVVAVPLLNALGGRSNPESWRTLMVIYAIVCLISYVFCVKGARKFDLPDKVVKVNEDKLTPETKFQNKPTFKNQIWTFARNLPLILLIIGFSTDMFASVMVQSINLYFFDYNLGGNDALYSLVNFGALIVGFVPFFVLPFLLKRVSKKWLMIVFEALAIVFPLTMWFVGWENITLIAVSSIMGGLFGGFTGMCAWMCVPDCADYAEWKYDTSVAGLSSAVVGLSNQFMQAIAGFASGAILTAVGFLQQSATQSMEVMEAIFAMRIWFPIAAFAITIIAMLFYPLNKKTEVQMEKELTERRKVRMDAATALENS